MTKKKISKKPTKLSSITLKNRGTKASAKRVKKANPSSKIFKKPVKNSFTLIKNMPSKIAVL